MDATEVAQHPAGIPQISATQAPQDDRGTAHFHGRERAFFWLLVRGSVYLMLTLGIYRFWLATDVRRFLWGHTEIAGDHLEYAGTARELLIGFLMALALLVPVYTLFAIAALDLGALSALSGLLSFVLLGLLGQFAVFRARRYRLARTVFRGVRMYQTGSAWRYAFMSAFWMLLTALTLGLAYPWSVAVLERYKMRHTHFGDITGRFTGSGTRLFFRGVLLWLMVVGPFMLGLAMMIVLIDWVALAEVAEASGSGLELLTAALENVAALGVAILGIVWSVGAALVFYPLFRAMVLRWWINGAQLGGITAVSHLRTGQIYRVYLRFLGYSMLFGIVAGFVGGGVLWALGGLSPRFGVSTATEIAAVVVSLVGYVIVMLGYSAIYQATVTIRFWRLSFETTELSGLRVLDHVSARPASGSPFGEGLADALDVGGL